MTDSKSASNGPQDELYQAGITTPMPPQGTMAVAADQVAVFKVAMINAVGATASRPGTVVLEPQSLTLRTRGTFGIRRKVVVIPLDGIINVRQAGEKIIFERSVAGKRPSLVTVRTKSADDAAKLAALLPARATPEFIEAQRKETEKEAAYATNIKTATRIPFITPLLVAANLVMFVITGIAGAGWFDANAGALLQWGGDHWYFTTAGGWWRLLSSAFLHLGIFHLLFNMQALLVAGLITERLFGNVPFLAIYVASALVSGLASIWWDQNSVIVGASGAVFAIYGALLAYVAVYRQSLPKRIVEQLGGSALAFLAYNVYFAIKLGAGNISHAAHIGGLCAGFILGAVMARPLDLARRARQTVPRLIAGAVLACLAIAFAVLYIPKSGLDLHGEEALEAACQSMNTEELRLQERYIAMLNGFDAGKINAAEVQRTIDQEILPAWDSLIGRITSVPLGQASMSKPIQNKILQYGQIRHDAMRAMSGAMHAYSGGKVEEFNTRVKESQKLWQEAHEMATSELPALRDWCIKRALSAAR